MARAFPQMKNNPDPGLIGGTTPLTEFFTGNIAKKHEVQTCVVLGLYGEVRVPDVAIHSRSIAHTVINRKTMRSGPDFLMGEKSMVLDEVVHINLEAMEYRRN